MDPEIMTDTIVHDHGEDGIDRRGFLKCMAWAGTGALWVMQSGVLRSMPLTRTPGDAAALKGDLFFAQISDSHIGFSKEANPDVTATLQAAVDRLNAQGSRPAFVLHTGDISQLSKPREFDTADQVIKGIRTDRVFYVPGEHDVLGDNGKQYLARYGRKTRGDGWYSFDHSGVHFVGLVNVLNLKPGGLGIGPARRSWCSPTCRCGPSIRTGGGAPTTASRHWRCSSVSARSRCSTVTSTRSCRRSRGTWSSTRPCPRPSRSPRRAPRRHPARSRWSRHDCAACSASPA
jgi:hypothetical protein